MEDLGFYSHLGCEDYYESSHTSDLQIGSPVATLPGAWRCGVSIGTGWPGVSILGLGEVESLICTFCLRVAARTIVFAHPSLRYASMLLGREATNQQTNLASAVSLCVWLCVLSVGQNRVDDRAECDTR